MQKNAMKPTYKIHFEKFKKSASPFPLDGKIKHYGMLAVFSGNMEYVVNGTPYSLSDGDILFMPPGTERKRLKPNGDARYFSLNFFTDTAISLPVYIPGALTKDLRILIEMFDKVFNDLSDLYADERINNLMELILISLRESSEKKAQNFSVDRILKYIDATFTKSITLSDIASYVDLTVPYCCSLVKKELGCTIYELISRKRISLAQYYITETDLPFEEIYVKCGFNSYSTFVKCFKNVRGITPCQYREA